MSEKNRDRKGRWRSKVVAFRMSEAENDELNTMVSISGLTKQDYIIKKLLNKDVIVKGNPRVFKSLKDLLVNIHADLVKSSLNNPPSPELLDTIKTVSTILGLLASVENSN